MPEEEHDTLQRALAQLERVLGVSEAPSAAQERCRSVMRLLQAHIQHEDESGRVNAHGPRT